MTRRQRLLSILIGVVGAIGSVIALAGFLVKVSQNALDIPKAATPQAFYQSVGAAYTGGFTAGFSLCFFLTLLAVAVGTWVESRRSANATKVEPVLLPLVRPLPPG